MSSENGKTVFEEASAERELEELRRAIEESRGRRRRANEAFDEFLKGFGEARGGAVPAPQPMAPQPTALQPDAQREHQHHAEHAGRAEHGSDETNDDGLFKFALASPTVAAAPVTPPCPAMHSPLDDFAQERPPRDSSPLRSIPTALAPARRSPARRLVPVVAIAVGGLLAAFLLWRGRSHEAAAPPVAVTAPPPTAAAAPASPAAATSGSEVAPSAEISTSRRVWLRVTVDGERLVEREVAEGTKIPLNAGSQIVIRAGDAGAVRVSIAGEDQGLLGPSGQVATRTFTVKP